MTERLDRYATKADAIADGWIPAHGVAGARDVSGPNAFGYAFEVDVDGVTYHSHTISLTEATNKIGQIGAVAVMFDTTGWPGA